MANLHVVATATDVSIPTTSETVVLTSTPAIEVNNPTGQGVSITGVANVIAGTGTTAVTTRVRRGTTETGTLIGEAKTHTLAAGNSASIAVSELDTASLTATNLQYVITVQQTAATGNGTLNSGAISLQSATAKE